MDFAQVELVLALDEARSLSGAAELLGTTTTAVSQQLRRLEREVGGEVFVRTPHGVVPTPAADLLLRRARRVATTMETLTAGRAGAAAELVRVTALDSAAEHLARAVRRARQQAPDLRVEIREARTAPELLAAVRDGRTGLGIGYLDARDVRWSHRRELVLDPLAHDECCVVLPPACADLPDPLPVTELPDLDVVTTTQDAVSRRLVERVLARAGVRRRAGIATAHRAMLVPLVRAGAGMAWTTLEAVAPAAPGVVVRRVVPAVTLPVYVVRPAEPPTGGAALLHALLTDRAAERRAGA